MKDYRLSEIKEICEKRKRINASCVGCEMEEFCFALNPASVDIEPRDMIELPHKEPYVGCIEYYDVFYRETNGRVVRSTYAREAEADAFMARLKEKRQ